MRQQLLDQIRHFPGRAGLYWQDLTTGEEAGVRQEEPFEAASVIKLPILVETFRQIEAGLLQENEPFLLRRPELPAYRPNRNADGPCHPDDHPKRQHRHQPPHPPPGYG